MRIGGPGLAPFALLGALTGCGDALSCPEGTRKVGSRCIELDTDDASVLGDYSDAGTLSSREDGGQSKEDDGLSGSLPVDRADANTGDGNATPDSGLAGPGAPERQCLVDADDDGYGSDQVVASCVIGVLPGDCDDSNPDVNPAVSEVCADTIDNDCDDTVDEAGTETCNGVDDDCDGVVDNGVKSEFFVDGDQDGSGTGSAIYACTQPDGTAPVAGDCDDQDAKFSPTVEEICDGIDNNCDGQGDETFACVKEATSVACATVCGSLGYGKCSSECTVPDPYDCTPPRETCNRADDDCDHVIDEDVLEALPSSRLWKAADGGNPASLPPATAVPRSGSGAWVLFDPEKNGSGIQAWRLDENRQAVEQVSSFTARTSGSYAFAADGDGKWVAVVASIGGSLRIQLFSAADLSYVGEQTFAGYDAVDISVFEDSQGTVRIFVPYATGTDHVIGTKRVISRSSDGTWSVGAPASLGLVQVSAFNLGLARIPCRDEWLIAGLRQDKQVIAQRLDAAGSPVEIPRPLLGSTVSSVAGVGAGTASCDSGQVEMLVATRDNGSFTHFVQLSVDALNGSLQLQGDLSLAYMRYVSVVAWGGRWFAAGISSYSGPFLAELTFANGQRSGRVIELHAQAGQRPVDSLSCTHSGLVNTGSALSVTFGADTGFNDGTGNPTGAAITYAVGCP